MKTVKVVMAAVWLAFLTGVSAGAVKYVAIVEGDIDEASGASKQVSRADVRLVTAEIRREAVKNLPPKKYVIMTSETVIAQGGAVLEECSEENCVVTLGSRIGADYIVRGIISKLRAKFTLSVEIYETDNGTLLASSEPIRSDNIEELVGEAAAACAAMYKTFANEQNSIKQSSTPQPEPTPEPAPAPAPPVTYTVAVSVNPAKGGAVSRNPNQAGYAPGTRVNVAAAPAKDYTFIGWSGATWDTVNPVTIIADSNKTLTANFQKTKRAKPVKEVAPPQQPIRKEYTLTTTGNPPDGGSVIRTPDKETYLDGETVTVTAVSADGYRFADWTGTVTSRTNRAIVTMNGDKTLTANFYKRSLTTAAPKVPASKTIGGNVDGGESVRRTKRIKWTEEDYRADSAKNILMVDAVPLINSVFTAIGAGGSFGLGLQYERRLYRKFSLVGRYDYFGVWDYHDSYYNGRERVKDWSSHLHSFETHARYYPTGKIFFWDGMLGYYVNTISGDYYNDHYSSGTYDYFKWGASFGWLVRSPRKTSGFTYEVSFGWNFAINSHYKSVYYDNWGNVTNNGFVDGFGFGLGGAGPRFVSAIGWRF